MLIWYNTLFLSKPVNETVCREWIRRMDFCARRYEAALQRLPVPISRAQREARAHALEAVGPLKDADHLMESLQAQGQSPSSFFLATPLRQGTRWGAGEFDVDGKPHRLAGRWTQQGDGFAGLGLASISRDGQHFREELLGSWEGGEHVQNPQGLYVTTRRVRGSTRDMQLSGLWLSWVTGQFPR